MLVRLVPWVVAISSTLLLACSEAPKDSVGSSGTTMSVTPPPTDSDALTAWLEQGMYSGYVHESAVHPSAGPHGSVRVFFGPELVRSLTEQQTSHPVGSVAVKELYDDAAGSLTGWAVSIKVAEDGVKEDWLWYERARASTKPSSNRRGQPICASCHESGQDYVVTSFPLR